MTVSRRKFIAIAGTSAASVWLTLDSRELRALGARAMQAKQFTVLSAADAADIEAAASQIIPTDETPGAREARVVYFIDRALATVAKEQRPVFAKGAKELRLRAAKLQPGVKSRSEEHTSELQSLRHLVCRLMLEKKKQE